jgi:hypothetical protein
MPRDYRLLERLFRFSNDFSFRHWTLRNEETKTCDLFLEFVLACVRITRNVSELKAAVSVELLSVYFLFKDKIVLNIRVFKYAVRTA